MTATKVVKVNRAQVEAARLKMERDEARGMPVDPRVALIAGAQFVPVGTAHETNFAGQLISRAHTVVMVEQGQVHQPDVGAVLEETAEHLAEAQDLWRSVHEPAEHRPAPEVQVDHRERAETEETGHRQDKK